MPPVSGPVDTEAIRIEYVAAASCPSADSFRARFFARTDRARAARDEDDANARTVRVRVTGGARRFAGSLIVEEGRTPRGERSVSARTCLEVVDALALIAALTVDPEASTTANGGAPPAQRPLDPLDGLFFLHQDEANETATPLRLAPRGPPPLPGAAWAAGATLGVRSGVGPALVPTAGLFIDLEWPGRSFRPSARATLMGALPSEATRGDRSATFQWLGGRFDLCPLRTAFGRFVVTPCLAVETGTLLATAGANVPDGQRERRAWVATGGLATATFYVLPHAFVGAEAGALALLLRERFYFDPTVTVFEPPPVSVLAGLVVGVRP